MALEAEKATNRGRNTNFHFKHNFLLKYDQDKTIATFLFLSKIN